ncbi:MAG: outer membrane lipid asymmetry maintenance protein MlaD [Deltaproteobacteria bacterium]
MKKASLEILVGLFMVAGFLAFVYVSLQFGEFSIFSMDKNYELRAEFTNVSGLKDGATVEIAGVSVGKVSSISLDKKDRAMVVMLIEKKVRITDDAIASIRTQGIIGDKYVKISQGGSDKYLKNGGTIFDTESAVDLEELISKYIFGKV